MEHRKLNELENEAGFGDIGESVRVSSEASQRANSLQGNVDEILNTLPDQSNSVRRLAVTVNDLNQNVDISDNQRKAFVRLAHNQNIIFIEFI